MEIYLIIGAFAGITSGLFGIGGGIIIVPALASIFTRSTLIPASYVMHMAIGTSLATMIFTSFSGAFSHYRRGGIRWDILKQVLPLLLLGVLFGTFIATYLPSKFLKSIFAIFLTFFSIRLLLNPTPKITRQTLSKKIINVISVTIGALTSILGAGGGTMLVPFFLRLDSKLHEALGTSLTCAFFISLVASICFMLTSLLAETFATNNTGYIYWPAFLGIIISSVLFAPVGTALAHKISTHYLKRLFAIFLLLIAIDMLFFVSR